MRYGVLGSLDVAHDGRSVDVGSYKQRALLAILLIERNRAVPADVIIDRLWEGRPPASASGTLKVYLSHLRKALHADGVQPLITQAPGYLLRVDAGDVDADRFAELAQAGSAAMVAGDAYAASELLDQALALWRGPALADFLDETFARDERRRLEELLAQATEDRVEADLALGRHTRVLPELQTLVTRYPLRERLRGQLMIALYRSGRQADALEVYRQGREELADELGIDPGPALQKLEQAILQQDAALDAPPAHTVAGTSISAKSERNRGVVDGTAEPLGSSNLNEPLTPIIGRGAELDDVTALLETCRLVTLTGPGGTGKTRLATAAAQRLLRENSAGAWLVELAGLQDQRLLPNAVAHSLGLAVQGDRDVPDIVADAMRDRAAVLVMDNCEHVLDAAAEFVGTVLARCPRLRVLATSREALGVDGERVYPLAPLPVVERTDEARLIDGDAMKLFETRAAAVVPGFAITAENRSVVRAICRELDGLPLAVELAAARMRVLSPEQLAERLWDRFSLLAGGRRTLEPRQRALRATVEWSYDLLDPEEQQLFRMVGTFSGGFELDAVARLSEGSAVEVLDLLDALVNKSLVTVDTTASPRRYGMLETLRQYARQVVAPEEAADLAARHAQWCAELVVEAESGLRGDNWRRWLRRLDAEHDNIRTGVAFALDHSMGDLAAQIVGCLGWYWFRRGYVDEARQWLERCAAVRGDSVSAAWSRVVMSLGTVRQMWGRVDEARALADQAIALAREAGDSFAEAEATVYSAYFAAPVDTADAQRRADEGFALVRDLGVVWLEAEAIMTLGNIARIRGDLESAERLVLEGVEHAANVGYWWQEHMARWNSAKVALARGAPHLARDRLRGVVQELWSAGDTAGIVVSLQTLAGAVAQDGDPAMGAVLLGALAAYADRAGIYPERIDPADAAWINEEIRMLLSVDDFTTAFVRGRAMSSEELAAVVDELAGT